MCGLKDGSQATRAAAQLRALQPCLLPRWHRKQVHSFPAAKRRIFAGSGMRYKLDSWTRRAVEQADTLVAGTKKRLAKIFAEERNKLESQWDKGETLRRKICGWRCGGTGRFSVAYCQSNANDLNKLAALSVRRVPKISKLQSVFVGPCTLVTNCECKS
jgi:hypothetical protein